MAGGARESKGLKMVEDVLQSKFLGGSTPPVPNESQRIFWTQVAPRQFERIDLESNGSLWDLNFEGPPDLPSVRGDAFQRAWGLPATQGPPGLTRERAG